MSDSFIGHSENEELIYLRAPNEAYALLITEYVKMMLDGGSVT